MNYPYILHELRNRSHRTLINILGIAVGIGLYVAINAVASGYQQAVTQPFENLGADLIVQRPEKNKQLGQETMSMRGIKLPFSNQALSGEELSGLRGLQDVAAASGSLLLWEFRQGGFRTVMGVDLSQPDLGPVRVKQWISQGRSLEQPGDALVEKHFAKFLHIGVGDTIDVGGKSFPVVGLLEIKEGAQVAAANVYLSLADAQTLLPDLTDPVNVVYLRLRDPALQDSVRQGITKAKPLLSVSSSDSFLELMGGVSLVSGWFSFTVSGIALLGAILLVLKSMTASLVERIPEIGVLKALGWTKRNIQGQLFGEAMLQCLVGGLLGIVLGYLGAYLIGLLSIPMSASWELNPLPASAKASEAASQVIRLPISLSWQLIGMAWGFSLMIGALASFIMGKSTEKMRPADIFKKI